MTFNIANDVALPDFSAMSRRGSGSSPYPFDQMTAVGQSFAVPYEESQTDKGKDTNTYKRMRSVVSARNARDKRKTFNLLQRVEDGAQVVRVWLTEVNPDAPAPAPKSTAAAPAGEAPAPAPAPAPAEAPAAPAPAADTAAAPKPAVTAAQKAAAATAKR